MTLLRFLWVSRQPNPELPWCGAKMAAKLLLGVKSCMHRKAGGGSLWERDAQPLFLNKWCSPSMAALPYVLKNRDSPRYWQVWQTVMSQFYEKNYGNPTQWGYLILWKLGWFRINVGLQRLLFVPRRTSPHTFPLPRSLPGSKTSLGMSSTFAWWCHFHLWHYSKLMSSSSSHQIVFLKSDKSGPSDKKYENHWVKENSLSQNR